LLISAHPMTHEQKQAFLPLTCIKAAACIVTSI